EQPISRWRLTEHAELERFELRRLESEQAFGGRYAVEPFSFHIDQGVGRAVVGLGGRRQLESDGYADDQVAFKAVGGGIASAQRVANESQALREPRGLERPSQLARKELGNLVLEAFSRAVRERKVVRVLADAQHTIIACRLILLRRLDRQRARPLRARLVESSPAATNGRGQICTGKIGAGEIRIDELRAAQIGAGKACGAQIGAAA